MKVNLFNTFKLNNLEVWNQYLQDNVNTAVFGTNPYNNSSTYFSAPMLFDIWGESRDYYLNFLYFQNFIDENTTSTVIGVNNVSKNSSIVNNSFVSNIFSTEIAELLNLFGLTTLNDITLSIARDMKSITETKYDVEGMRSVLGYFKTHIEDIDVQCEEGVYMFDNLSTPDFKLFYPEPFIASPSFVHEDLWFIHILHYQHWLWFMFISLIMFYFITFINVVRWCNLRTKPKRETRGVSRSKCADLITACVPVSWAISIIISETVDATDYYDGFSTGEIVIGIRAYQWGWEYFYPKGIDLNYNVNPSYSSMVGNSLKYTNAGTNVLNANTLWKYYQNKKTNKLTSTPAHLLLSPTDNSKLLNFMNFNDVASNMSSDSTAFKKIQYFSKTNPQSLFSNSAEYEARYNKLADLYFNDVESAKTGSYGTFRQHNYSTTKALNNNFYSKMESKNIDNFLNYNTALNSKNSSAFSEKFNDFSSLKTYERKSELTSSLKLRELALNLPLGSNSAADITLFDQFLKFKNKSLFLNSETDSKQVSNAFKYSLWSKFSKKTFLGKKWLNENWDLSDITNNTPLLNMTSKVQNNSLYYRFKDLKSSNLSYLTGEKNVRLIDNVPTQKTNINLSTSQNNLNSLIANNIVGNISNSSKYLFLNSSLNWNNLEILKQLASSGTKFTQSHIPVQSNKAGWDSLSYTKYLGQNDLTPDLMKSKEESAPNYLFNAYWLTYWAHTSQGHRLSSMIDNSKLLNNSYLPLVTNYTEYDFKNWQTLELLEDAFWESTYSAYSHDEYLNILESAKNYEYFTKQEEFYNISTRHKKFRSGIKTRPFTKDINNNSTITTPALFTEDPILNLSLLNTKNFNIFGDETSVDSLDDSYENASTLNSLSSDYSLRKNFLTKTNAPSLMSYARIMDNFRADHEENIISNDNSTLDNNSLVFPELANNDTHNSIRSTNPLKLRSTTKNAIVTYNAMQKVFRSRYDEGRSNARLQDLSNSYNSHPFITAPKSPYESFLGKNKENFFNVNSYKQYFRSNFSEMFSVWNSLNVYFADLPFLVSAKSDPSRYLWFDWQSRWSSIEIQPSSVARYSLLGVPYSTKNFEYSTSIGDEINDSENYLVRLARSRKNYITNWAYTPYFYSRVSNWYKLNSSTENLFNEAKLSSLKVSLKSSSLYWKSKSHTAMTKLSTPSHSGLSTPGRSSWKPMSSVQSYNYTTSILVDILTKREYLYRQYFYNKGLTLNLPKYLTASPNNSLLTEVKAAFPLIDPVTFSSEISREFLYQNTSFLRFNLIREFLNVSTNSLSSLPINPNVLTNYTFFYLFGNNKGSSVGKNLELYKNQYRPMKKGVTNMIRLHATGAIAMPIEIRLHILASSKDVIHSWAIPSAGIKIDCVPGYSSHRVAIFLVSGIFWGQCMEICGRFHHWMPIIVYFMKRDLFFLWCTHFMHYSTSANEFLTTDKQLTNKINLASYDSMSWVKEINQLI